VSDTGAGRRRVRALGIDPGSKRIGLAISDRSGTIASPLTVLARSRSRGQDDAEIARIVREKEVDVVVIGLPVNMDGSHGASAKAAIADARRLATVVDVPIELHDERRTTVSAERSMRDAGLDGVARRQRVDKVAAAIMLQSWLDAQARSRP
jgi:putative Holliday junction resolvase